MIQPHFHTCYFTAERMNIQTQEWRQEDHDKAVIQVTEDASHKQAFRGGVPGVEVTSL